MQPRRTWPWAAAAAADPLAAPATVNRGSPSDAGDPALVSEGGHAGTRSPTRSVRRRDHPTCDLPGQEGEKGGEDMAQI